MWNISWLERHDSALTKKIRWTNYTTESKQAYLQVKENVQSQEQNLQIILYSIFKINVRISIGLRVMLINDSWMLFLYKRLPSES